MSRIFISHSSKNDDVAIALRDWLDAQGWAGADDVFLDLDPERGIAAGERWRVAFEKAITRCEAVLFVVSNDWLTSKWCNDEYHLATIHNKPLFALLVEEVPRDKLPGGMAAQWQYVPLKGEPARRFITTHPKTLRQSPVHIAETALVKIKRGLEKAGVSPSTFDLASDPTQPTGWRMPYRGLEALEPQDAAVFFGRDHDIVRGLDELRGIASNPPPRLMAILGASGAGKSSYLRAGLWPRLARDDLRWLPLLPIRAGRGGALEGSEGLISALEDVHRRLGLKASRADLRKIIMTSAGFVDVLTTLRSAAASRALRSEPPFPLPVICLDQAEELFAVETGTGRDESERLIALARAAMDSDAALVLATIRSDSYNVMQTAKALAGIHQHTFSLGPVPGGEVANIIREPAKLLRRKVGPIAPEFDDAVVSQLQDEVAGEADALPLLAFVLERLMRENAAKPVIGINELDQTGGIADAIKAAAEAALNDAGIRQDDVARRNILRRLFIPALARIEPKTRVVQRRTARLDTLDSDLVALAKSLTARRLLVTRKTAGEFASTVTVEVAHEALLRRWTVLDALLAEDRDALMLLDATLVAADDWTKAQSTNKRDFIVHHGSRLADARALASRGAGWARDIAAADDYLSACSMAERTRLEKEARAAKWLKRWAAAASVLVVLASVATWWAWDNSQGILVRNHEIARQSAALESASEAAILAKQQAEQARDTAVDEAKKAQLAKELASKNLQDAMRTESLFRAQQAQAALKSGDAVTSMILALDGLPDASSETEIRRNRPWVIEAEAALRAALRSQKERQVFVGHTGPVTSLAYISDDRIVTGSKDETARLWDVASGKELMQFRGHSDEITSVTVMSDERIVTGSRDATVRIWNTSTGMEFLRIDNNDESVTSVAISPKGQIIVGSQRGYVRLWDSKTGEMISEIAAGAGGVTAVAVTEDGDIVTGHSNGTTSVWSAESGKRILQLKHDDYELPVTCLAITIDGYIVVGSYDGVARQWSRSTGDKIAEFRGHRGPIRSIAASSNGSRIVTGADDQTARVWQADSAVALEQFVGHVAPVLAVTFFENGKVLTGSADGTARLWDKLPRGRLGELSDKSHKVTSVASIGDGRIVTSSKDATARLWDRFGQELLILRGHREVVTSVAMAMNGQIVTGSWDGTIRVWDLNTGRQEKLFESGDGGVARVAVTPEGLIVAGHLNGTVKVYDVISSAQIASFKAAERLITSIATTSNGGVLVATLEDSTARLWDLKTGKERVKFVGHRGGITSLGVTSDARIVTGSVDGTARIWDSITGKELIKFVGHEAGITSIAVTADGQIFTGSGDKTARVWDAVTGKEILKIDDEREQVAVVLSTASGQLLIGGEYGGLSIWEHPRAGELRASANRRLPRCLTPVQFQEAYVSSTELARFCAGNARWPFDPVGAEIEQAKLIAVDRADHASIIRDARLSVSTRAPPR